RLDAAVGEDFLVTARCPAAVLGREFPTLLIRAGVAGRDRHLSRALDGVGEHVRPPAHADACHLHLIDSAASRASFSSYSQLPPATPTAPMHCSPTMIGQPPSIAVQRSAPA